MIDSLIGVNDPMSQEQILHLFLHARALVAHASGIGKPGTIQYRHGDSTSWRPGNNEYELPHADRPVTYASCTARTPMDCSPTSNPARAAAPVTSKSH